jgi:hypothetical protein
MSNFGLMSNFVLSCLTLGLLVNSETGHSEDQQPNLTLSFLVNVKGDTYEGLIWFSATFLL